MGMSINHAKRELAVAGFLFCPKKSFPQIFYHTIIEHLKNHFKGVDHYGKSGNGIT